MNPLFVDAFVVEADDDGSRTVTGTAPGPAGSATITVAPGVTLGIDYADPSVMTSIHIEPTADTSVLEPLLGDRRADAVRTAHGRAPRRVGRLGEVHPNFSSRPEGEPPSELARLASLVSFADDTQRTSLARGVAWLEVAHAALERVEVLLDAQTLAEAALDRARPLLDDARTEVPRLGHHSGRLRMLLDAAADMGNRDTQQLVQQLIAHLPHRAADVDGEHVSDTDGRQVVELRPNGRLVVTVADAEGSWLRVIDRDSFTLLALVPFLADDTGFVADAIVPPERTRAELSIEVSDAPLLARSGGSTLDEVRSAFRAGRRAVEVQPRRATLRRRLWLECADRWEALGDPFRANLARTYADEPPPRLGTLSEQIEQHFHPSS